MKTYVAHGDIKNLVNTEQKKRETTTTSEIKMRESSSLSDQKMRHSFSQSEHGIKETNGNTEEENIDNGNISTDITETESASDEVNI